MIRKFFITGAFIASCFCSSVTAQTNERTLTLKDTIKDLSIEIPQDLEKNLEDALVNWKKNYRKDPTCNQSQSDITYSDSEYIQRLYALPSEMELAYNPIVQSYIDMYTSARRRKSVEYMLGKGNYYFPMIEETLDRYGLPLELKYLPIIESALNPIAKSRAGATGLWQFMLRTGKMYDLEVNTLVDERKDPRKATEAAARFLKDLYDIYGDWNLVIAAYNCGPGNVNKAIKRSGGLTDYWAIYPHLPRETRGYVPAFIAATYVMNYYHLHNMCPMEESYPISVDTLWIDKNLHLRQVAEKLDISIEDIKQLNPQYQKDIIPGDFKKYPLCLPSKTLSEFIVKKDEIYNHKTQEYLTHRRTVQVEDSYVSSSSTGKATKTHKVRSGESLGSIARKYGVSVAHLRKMNNMKSNKLYAGKHLVISRQSVAKKKTATPAVTTSESNTTVLAQAKTNTSSSQVIAEQDTTQNNFFADYYKSQGITSQEDSVNNDGLAEAPKKDVLERIDNEDIRTIYHKVKIGETILQIANKYNVDSKDVLAWNKMSSKKVKIGQRLMIKVSGKTIEPEVEPEAIEQSVLADNTPKVEEPKKKNERTVKVTSQKENKKKSGPVVYHVRKGDSLYLIAKRYKGVSARDIKLANNLKSDKLSIGQRLNIPTN